MACWFVCSVSVACWWCGFVICSVSVACCCVRLGCVPVVCCLRHVFAGHAHACGAFVHLQCVCMLMACSDSQDTTGPWQHTQHTLSPPVTSSPIYIILNPLLLGTLALFYFLLIAFLLLSVRISNKCLQHVPLCSSFN